jgi:hypothetical protein
MGRGKWGDDVGAGHCEACGAPLPARAPGTPGTPPRYCDAKTTERDCGRFMRVLSQLGSYTDAILEATPPKHRKAVRAKLVGIWLSRAGDARAAG